MTPAKRREVRIQLEDELPWVEYLPPTCPACGGRWLRTYGRRGRIRYHRCRGCGLRFRSIEVAVRTGGASD